VRRGFVLLTGAGSAIARAVARRMASRGWNLIVAGRDEADAESLASDLRVRFGCEAHAAHFDAIQANQHEPFFQRCAELAGGRLEGMVVGHGFMADQAAVERDPSLLAQTISVNYTSPALLASLAADHLSAQGRGFICVISSVAGDRGRASNFAYGSSKAAIDTYVEGLRHRLARQGRVRVITVKPGFVDTAMTWGLLKPGSPLVASPERVARSIVRAIEGGRPVVYTPWVWRWVMLAIRALPRPIFNRLNF
jgi:short-subunit dehydrogenase